MNVYLVVIWGIGETGNVYNLCIEYVVDTNEGVQCETTSDPCPVVVRCSHVIGIVRSCIDGNDKPIPRRKDVSKGTNELASFLYKARVSLFYDLNIWNSYSVSCSRQMNPTIRPLCGSR